MTDMLTFDVGMADRRSMERRCVFCDAPVDRPKSPYCSTACYRKAWEIANRERRAAYQQDWYQANRDRVNDQARAWQKANPERFREIRLAYYDRNRERMIAYSTKWIGENRDRFNETRNRRMRTPKGRMQRALGDGRRRARMLENGYETIPADAWAAKLAEYGGCCAYCGAPATERDHVVPLARGGTHTLDNLVPACSSCNRVKHAQLVSEWRTDVTETEPQPAPEPEPEPEPEPSSLDLGTDMYAPNQQAVRGDQSGPAEEGEGGTAAAGPPPGEPSPPLPEDK